MNPNFTKKVFLSKTLSLNKDIYKKAKITSCNQFSHFDVPGLLNPLVLLELVHLDKEVVRCVVQVLLEAVASGPGRLLLAAKVLNLQVKVKLLILKIYQKMLSKTVFTFSRLKIKGDIIYLKIWGKKQKSKSFRV